ncbi:hypothetical protein JXB02_00215 [Candidatus Woesearchaeota archaeon]|nr:hypothetical protein [Candidatus Woesearchaeota archaeon]
MKESNLKDRILKEMTVNYSNTLEKNFETVKEFIRITSDGKVDVIIKDRLTGKEQVLLYLIGKLYAKEAGLVPSAYVSKEEIMDELGVPEGSVFPWLKNLSDKRMIKKEKKGNKIFYSVAINVIEKVIKNIDKKIHEMIENDG